MLKNYLKTAIRNLWRNPGFSVINISGLAIGMAAFLLIIHYVSFEKSYESYNKYADNIYRVTLDLYNGSEYVVTDCETYPPLGPALKEKMPEVEDFVRVQKMEEIREISYLDKHFMEERVFAADPSVFKLFDLQLVKGNINSVLKSPMQLVITESMAKKYFGDVNAIGKTVKLTPKKESLEIVGVIKDLPLNTHLKMDFLVSWSSMESWGWDMNSWNGNNNYTYLKLSPTVNLVKFNEELKAFSKTQLKRKILVAEPINDIHLYSHKTFEPEVNGNAQTVNFLLIISVLIILIVSINYINLTTAKSIERAKEVGIRKIIGSSRRSIIAQSITEFLLINVIAALLALILIQVSSSLYVEVIGKNIPMNLLLSLPFWQTLLTLFLFNIILSGLYPAIALSATKPASIIGRSFTGSPKGNLLRKGLVVGQFMATFILLAGTIIIYKQVHYMKHQNLGMDTEEVLVVRGPALTNQDSLEMNKTRLFKTTLQNNPHIKKVSASESLPGVSLHELNTSSGIVQYGQEATSGYNYYIYSIDSAFIPLMNIQMVAGKNYSPGLSRKSEVIINEEAARMLGFKDAQQAVGKKITLGWNDQPFLTVAGVVQNYHQQSLKEKHLPMIHPYLERANGYFALKVQTGNLKETIDEVKQAWNTTLPGHTFNYYFLDEMFDQQYKSDLQFGKITGVFSGIAIFLASLGLLGLISFSTHQRTKEIGIRKVLGASVAGIVTLLSKDFIKLVLIAIVIASPLAYYGMTVWLQEFAYKIDLNQNLWIFVVAGLLALFIALLTISFQAINAALANPVKSLRTE